MKALIFGKAREKLRKKREKATCGPPEKKILIIYKKVDKVFKVCGLCGSTFETTEKRDSTYNAIYCSVSCRRKIKKALAKNIKN